METRKDKNVLLQMYHAVVGHAPTLVYCLSEEAQKVDENGKPGAHVIWDKQELIRHGITAYDVVALLIVHPDNLEVVKERLTDYNLVPLWEE